MKKAPASGHITLRAQLVQRIRRELEDRGYPRIQMMLLVAVTGGMGFLASYTLLTLGIDSLPMRYLLSVGIAYLIFLLLLWIWLRTSSHDGIDDISDALDAFPQGEARGSGHFGHGGGDFGGGGSSGHWDANPQSDPFIELPEIPLPDLDVAIDGDELAIPLAVLAIVAAVALGVLLVSASVIWSAPILFAELIVDGVLSATLYRRLRRLEPRHWLQSALRRTLVPFAATALLVTTGGWGLSIYAPQARTLGDVFHMSHAALDR